VNVVILSEIWPAAIEQLRARHPTRVALAVASVDLPQVLHDAEVVVLRSGVRLDRTALEQAPQLRLIVRAGSGLEGIDCDFARERRVRVVNVPLSAESVAEHALGLMLALCHKITRHDAALRAGRWEKHTGFGRDLFGRHLGLLGFGRIGQRIGELGRAFGMTVSACDRSPQKTAKQAAAARLKVSFVVVNELFASADVVAIQTPLNDSTRGLVDRRLLATMKRDAILINVGRGGTVDETALYEALRDGRLAGAALDVFQREPPGDHPLLTLSNFVGTPHVAAQTQDAQERVGWSVVRVIDAFAAGEDWSAHGVVVV
jgi:D-3-phosphoglycerate dehydrogenase / 2-oxoglutarate reductase